MNLNEIVEKEDLVKSGSYRDRGGCFITSRPEGLKLRAVAGGPNNNSTYMVNDKLNKTKLLF